MIGVNGNKVNKRFFLVECCKQQTSRPINGARHDNSQMLDKVNLMGVKMLMLHMALHSMSILYILHEDIVTVRRQHTKSHR